MDNTELDERPAAVTIPEKDKEFFAEYMMPTSYIEKDANVLNIHSRSIMARAICEVEAEICRITIA